MKIFTIKKHMLCVFVGALVILCTIFGTVYAVKTTSSPKPVHTIVIDAGHGGRDGGAVGAQTDVTESYLNLQYSLTLQKICEGYGYHVIMTRSDMNGLYSPLASNKKRSEMEKRESIIQNSNADVVVSIHMNSFSSREARGAQVYYAEGSQAGEALAENVQNNLKKNVNYAKSTAKIGDFYVLNCTDCPSILVECGFLSNPEEELLLQDESYMQDFCYHLFCGILTYFNFE